MLLVPQQPHLETARIASAVSRPPGALRRRRVKPLRSGPAEDPVPGREKQVFQGARRGRQTRPHARQETARIASAVQARQAASLRPCGRPARSGRSSGAVVARRGRTRGRLSGARIIPDAAVAAVAASLKRFGWQQAIVADPKGVIVAGETRYKAAVLLGLTAAPVVTIQARQARAFRVIDNRTSELTSWDTDLLPDALSGLNDLDIFSFDDVLPLAATAGKTDPDDIPEPPKKPITRTGDLWVLGKHRIVCGDSTNQETVERLLDGAEPDLMVTDPPYGVNYDATWRYKAGVSTKDGAFRKVGKRRSEQLVGCVRALPWTDRLRLDEQPRPSGSRSWARRLRLHSTLAYHLGQGSHDAGLSARTARPRREPRRGVSQNCSCPEPIGG